jgi:nicotinate phosphoribosyltransferase
LGGVYKLSAIRDLPTDPWQYKLKSSEQLAKASFPGVLQVRRFKIDGRFQADLIYNIPNGIGTPPELVDPKDITRHREIDPAAEYEDLLVPVLRSGKRACELPTLKAIRQRAAEQLNALHPTHRRLLHPHEYPVGLERGLAELRTGLLREARHMKGKR